MIIVRRSSWPRHGRSAVAGRRRALMADERPAVDAATDGRRRPSRRRRSPTRGGERRTPGDDRAPKRPPSRRDETGRRRGCRGRPEPDEAPAEPSPRRRRAPRSPSRRTSSTQPSRRSDPAESDAEPEAPVAEPDHRRDRRMVIADALRAAGVRYAFTVPGESFLGLLEALADGGHPGRRDPPRGRRRRSWPRPTAS